MKNLTLAAIAALTLTTPAIAGETYTRSPEKYRSSEPCFPDEEWQVDIFGAYAFSNSNQDGVLGDHAWGGGLGLNYFFIPHVGLGIEGSVFDTRRGSDALGQAAFNVFFRFPIQEACFAPYLYGGIGGIFNAESLDREDLPGGDDSDNDAVLEGHVGIGVEYRFTRNVGIFVDGRYTFVDDEESDFATIRSGIKISF